MTKSNARRIEEPTFLHEDAYRQQGYRVIAGVDEAGRGPLAGPVVAAAVILPADLDPHLVAGLRDSKQLTGLARERFYQKIIRIADAYAAAQASPREIETLDIRKASLLAMKRAVEALPVRPDFVLVDGRDYPGLDLPGEALVRGDERSITIGAASIVAKVIRDRIMTGLHSLYPQYGLAVHKGYPTEYHRLAIRLFGVTDQHRTTFGGVKECLKEPALSSSFASCVQDLQALVGPEQADAYVRQLGQRGLTEPERLYLEQTVCHRVEELKREQRIQCPASVDRGRKWEAYAAEYLAQQGYVLWEQNFHAPGGEIDLVVNKGTQIVFVEVKAKSTAAFGQPFEAVTVRKRRSMIRTAEQYLYQRGLLDRWDVRYDVISILTPNGQTPVVHHFEDAFRSDDGDRRF